MTPGPIEVRRCPACAIVLDPSAPRCPACGGPLVAEPRSGRATVRAATELLVPPEGFPAPHRLLWVELEGGGTFVALAPEGLPRVGEGGHLTVDAQGRWLFRPGPPHG